MARTVFIRGWLSVFTLTACVFGVSIFSGAPVASAETEHDYVDALVAAARERTRHFVIYDGAYQRIAYPMGDVSPRKGVCTDVIIRSYRALGFDLQQAVHEDMRAHFDSYPTIWGLSRPDPNIDHRRVPNLEVFFKRHGQSLPVKGQLSDYQPGDLITWRLPNGAPHIGIVSDKKHRRHKRPLIIHNIGWGPKEEDALLVGKIVGHFRFPVPVGPKTQ